MGTSPPKAKVADPEKAPEPSGQLPVLAPDPIAYESDRHFTRSREAKCAHPFPPGPGVHKGEAHLVAPGEGEAANKANQKKWGAC